MTHPLPRGGTDLMDARVEWMPGSNSMVSLEFTRTPLALRTQPLNPGKGGIVIRRRISITVETDRILLMRQTKDCTKSWCDVCSRQVEMLRVADLSDSVVANLSTMFGEAEATRLHVVKTRSNSERVLGNFVRNILRQEDCFNTRIAIKESTRSVALSLARRFNAGFEAAPTGIVV